MKEQCRIAERFLPEVLTAPTKIIIRPVTRVTARAIVDMPLSLLFLQNYRRTRRRIVLQYYQVLQCTFRVIIIFHVQNCLRAGY